ncbi:conserved exported hypothetical protein [Candidatus Terasakiella magnetica]|nr:conserved exported hypothetical protein [Candidatus Terasakiella magnetica]
MVGPRLRVWGAAAILALLLPSDPAQARDLVVGVEAIDYLPAYGMRDGQFQGAGRAVLDAFAQAKGHRIIYRPYPVKRLLAELIHGGVDLKFPDSPDWQAAMRQGRSIHYSGPIIAYIDGTVVRRDKLALGVEGIHSIGTVAGFTPYAWSEYLKADKVDLKENPNFEQLLRQVITGRIDGAYVNVAVALTAVDKLADGAGALAYAPDLPHISDSYRLSATTKAADIITEFDAWMAANTKQVQDLVARSGAERGLH